MPVPNYKSKHLQPAFFSPSDFLEYRKEIGKGADGTLPQTVIVCYQKHIRDWINKHYKLVPSGLSHLSILSECNTKIGICAGFGIGGPAVVTCMEAVIAFGVRKIISIGTAGSLQSHLTAGDLIICSKAIRDEGTSYHYLPNSKFANASQSSVTSLKRIFEKETTDFTIGPTWTTDAPYKETMDEIDQYRREGILTVDMETASVYAMAQYRKIPAIAAFVVSDLLTESKWNPQFQATVVLSSLEKLFHLAVSASLQS